MSRSRSSRTVHRIARWLTDQTAATRRRARSCWRFLQAIWALPVFVRVFVLAAVIITGWSMVNWVYQAYRKPTELLSPISDALTKTPSQTWEQYGPLFRKHATAVITPEFLATLAQIEGGGNPVAQTYWRWRLTWNPFELYQPASSAVGMYQITDGTFSEAKRYCIHDHVVVEEGSWHDLHSCWFNSLYTRIVPSHAIEMTAALLDRTVASTVARRRVTTASVGRKQNLAAVIHLCGAGAGDRYAARGFRLTPRQRCGDHLVADYLAQVNALKQQFARLAVAGSETPRLVRPR